MFNKTHVNVTLARPLLINSSATHYTISGGRHFPPKINDDCLPWLLSSSLFYASFSLQTKTSKVHISKNTVNQLVELTLEYSYVCIANILEISFLWGEVFANFLFFAFGRVQTVYCNNFLLICNNRAEGDFAFHTAALTAIILTFHLLNLPYKSQQL